MKNIILVSMVCVLLGVLAWASLPSVSMACNNADCSTPGSTLVVWDDSSGGTHPQPPPPLPH